MQPVKGSSACFLYVVYIFCRSKMVADQINRFAYPFIIFRECDVILAVAIHVLCIMPCAASYSYPTSFSPSCMQSGTRDIV